MATPFRHPLLKDPPGWLTPALFLSAERNRYRCLATAYSIIIVARAGYTTSRKRGIQLPLDAHPAEVFEHTVIAFRRKLTANVFNGTAYPFPGQLKGSFDRRHAGVGHAAPKASDRSPSTTLHHASAYRSRWLPFKDKRLLTSFSYPADGAFQASSPNEPPLGLAHAGPFFCLPIATATPASAALRDIAVPYPSGPPSSPRSISPQRDNPPSPARSSPTSTSLHARTISVALQ